MASGLATVFFFKGVLVGLAIAAPVGPTALIIIRRTLTRGWRSGCATGLGAGTADAIYGFVAAFGLTLVGGFLMEQRSWLAFIGGVLLCGLGIQSWFSHPSERRVMVNGGEIGIMRLLHEYMSIFALTLANPMTILSFAAVIVAIGATPGDTETIADPLVDYPQMIGLVGGVFVGSVLWWFMLVAVSGIVRDRLSDQWLHSFNRLSGIGLLLFGAYVLFEAFRWAVQ
jgi:threonine/homoserine/homoserine lactone efflux protein